MKSILTELDGRQLLYLQISSIEVNSIWLCPFLYVLENIFQAFELLNCAQETYYLKLLKICKFVTE